MRNTTPRSLFIVAVDELRLTSVFSERQAASGGTGGHASQNGDFGADAWYRWEV